MIHFKQKQSIYMGKEAYELLYPPDITFLILCKKILLVWFDLIYINLYVSMYMVVHGSILVHAFKMLKMDGEIIIRTNINIIILMKAIIILINSIRYMIAYLKINRNKPISIHKSALLY